MVNFTFPLLELILADQLVDTPVESSSGEEWQFYIFTITGNTGRSLDDLSPEYSHFMVNFKQVLLQLILADQLADLPPW